MSENILEKSIGSGPTFPIQLTSGSWKPKNATRLLVYRFTKEAIEAWEPRVRLLETQIQFTPSEIQIRLRYQVLTNQMVGELDFSYQKSA